MINEYKIDLNGCVIDKEHLMSLVKIVDEHFGAFHLSFSFDDNTKIRDLTIKEFDRYDFSNLVIEEFELRGFKYDNKAKVDIDFLLTHLNSTDGYQLSFSSSDFTFYSVFKNIIEEWIKNVTVKSRTKIIKLLKYPFVLAYLISIVFALPIVFASARLFDISSPWIYVAIVIGFILLSLFVDYFVFDSIKESFPLVEIDIGDNKSKTIRKRNYFLLTIILIPLIYMLIGIIVPLVVNNH